MSVLIGQGSGGHGNGTFAAPVTYTTLAPGTGITAADVNQDGKLDLIVTEYNNNTIAIFPGVGNGTFSNPVHLNVGASAYDMLVADMTGDGIPDIVVGRDQGAGLWLFPGQGGLAFGSGQVLVSGGSCAPHLLADFDGDGIPDIEYTTSTSNTYSLLRGMGGGTFRAPLSWPVTHFPVFVATGDFNGDGIADAAIQSYLADSATVLLSTCATNPIVFSIDRVRDVPKDQGGKVWVTWAAHASDAGGGVASYRVWRRIPAASAASRSASALEVTSGTNGPIYWEAAAVLPAQRLPWYGYTLATAQDSLAGSNPYTAVFITAVDGYGSVIESTKPDSGYSVDNLAPAAPTQVQASYAGGTVVLEWAANAERDLSHYRVHRGPDPYFVPSAANLLGEPTAPAFTDPQSTGEYYKIAAVDVHGNIGAYVLVQPANPTGIDVSLMSADATPDGVTLTWYADAQMVPMASLERSQAEAGWVAIASGSPDGGGKLVFRDTDVTPGETYAYRLHWVTDDGDHTSAIASVTIPGRALALAGAWPNPARTGALALRFTLPDDSPATLALYDVGGRRVLQRAVGAMGPGAHALNLSAEHLSPGLYLARLKRGAVTRHARIVIEP
jgi:hypothetical protein